MTKIIAFVLAVALSGMVVWSVGMIALRLSANEFSPDILFDKNDWIYDVMQQQAAEGNDLGDALCQGMSEKRILAGETVSEQEIVDAMWQDYNEGYIYGNTVSDDGKAELTDKKIASLSDEIENITYQWFFDEGEYSDTELSDEIDLFEQWLKRNRAVYTVEKNRMIQDQLSAFYAWRNADRSDYLYYAASETNDVLITNVEGAQDEAVEQIRNCPLIYEYDSEIMDFKFSSAPEITDLVGRYEGGDNYDNFLSEDSLLQEMPSDAVLMIGLSPEVYDRQQDGIAHAYGETWALVIVLMVCLIAVVLCCIILCAGAGRSSLDAPAKLCKLDRIWTEAQVCYVGFVLVYGAVIAVWSIKWLTSSGAGGNLALYLIPPAIGGLVAALCLPCLMSQARRVKTHTFGQGFLCIRGLKWLINQWKKGPRYVRLIVLAVAVPIVCMPYITIPFVIAALLYFGIRYVKEMELLEDGVRRIRGGETGLHIEVKQNKDLERLADDINGISDGLHNAVDSAVKSERLKSELISNVSHDLKTPLTGIVTYVDLMKQLEPDDPKMMTYLGIVDQKTKRLSTLINDLLEASKASSGAMKLELTRVDFAALLQQACGEMQEKLDMAGLELRGRTRGRTDVCADGRMLWRVLDNLLGNCVRYAAPNSRVYTDLCERNGFCVFTIKNISAVELNIPAEELMERFTRGDRARYTEGSGLGLSIAKSLTELMHGSFSLTVDGDLFKVEVAIPLWDDAWETTRPLGPDFDPDATRRMG